MLGKLFNIIILKVITQCYYHISLYHNNFWYTTQHPEENQHQKNINASISHICYLLLHYLRKCKLFQLYSTISIKQLIFQSLP